LPWRPPMRTPLRPLLPVVLILTLTLAGHAWASVRASGLTCTAVGGASVSSLDGRSLSVTGVDQAGNAGCDFHLRSMDGSHFDYSSAWSSADDGSVLTYRWTLINRPAGSQATLSSARTADGVTLTCDLSSLSSSPSMVVLLYRSGSLVSSSTIAP